jgi:PAS domain S-box-containing protein
MNIEIIDCITDIFYVLDRQYCFKYVNNKCASYFNKTKQELIGKNFWELFPAFKNTHYPHFYKTMTEKTTLRFEYKASCSDSWFEINIYPLEDGIAVYYQDITKLKHTEMALRKSQQDTLDILESIGDGFIYFDKDFRFTYVNHAAKEMLGCTRDNLYGKTLSNIFPEASRTTIELSRKAMQDMTNQHVELYSMILKKWLELNVYPHKEGISMCFRDITERKKGEEQLRLANELFYKTINANPLPMAILTAKEERYIDVNDSFLNINGYTREEVIGATMDDINYSWVDTKHRSNI